MEFAWLELQDFRSYPALRLEPDPGVNVFVGPNGAGKTNLLEAATYLTSLRSFRSVRDETLVRDDAVGAIVRGEVHHHHHTSRSLIEVEIPRSGRRRVRVNGQRPTRATDLLGHVRGVVFLPDDLDIVKRGPAYRRDFFDATAVQLWPGAYLDQQDYDRALRQRNSLLRQSGWNADEATLAVWDDRLSEAAGRLMERRAGTFAALGTRVAQMYEELAASRADVQMRYASAWGGSVEGINGQSLAEKLRHKLSEARRADMERRVTTVGPHRDEPWFSLDGRDVRTQASQGEQRSLALSLRLAAHQAISEVAGEDPLLLLDDVFSELDLSRANALAQMLPSAQTFITTAREEEVPVHGRRFTVERGSIQ